MNSDNMAPKVMKSSISLPFDLTLEKRFSMPIDCLRNMRLEASRSESSESVERTLVPAFAILACSAVGSTCVFHLPASP